MRILTESEKDKTWNLSRNVQSSSYRALTKPDRLQMEELITPWREQEDNFEGTEDYYERVEQKGLKPQA